MDEKKDLIEDDDKIDHAESEQDTLDQSKSAVKAQENQTKRDEKKFPDPESIPMELYHRPNDGIGFPTLRVENHHGEQRIQDVQPHHQDQHKKQN